MAKFLHQFTTTTAKGVLSCWKIEEIEFQMSSQLSSIVEVSIIFFSSFKSYHGAVLSSGVIIYTEQ